MNAMTVPTAEGIASRIDIQVKRYGLTIPKAALACNLSQATFETYLYGKHMPGSVALISLSRGLKCPVGWLLTGEFDA